MCWKDSKSPWARAMRRKTWYREPLSKGSISVVSGLFLLLAFSFLIYSLVIDSDALFGISIIACVGIAFFGFIANPFLNENTSLVKTIPKNDGQVCPLCLKTIKHTKSECYACKRKYDESLLKKYWQQAAFDSQTAFKYLDSATNKPIYSISGKSTWRISQPRKRSIGVSTLIFNGLLFFILLVLHVLLQGNSFVEFLIELCPLLILYTGILLFIERYHRLDDSLVFCAECEYQQTPDQTPPEHCPECGNAWLEDGHSAIGTKIVTPWKLWVGVALIILGLASFFLDSQIQTAWYNFTGLQLPASSPCCGN